MLQIGITGGIGSGKTTVCKIFESIGIPVYYADDRAKALMVNDERLVNGIKELFGENAYFEDGQLNRTLLAKIAFQDKSILQQLNALVHPAVHLDAELWSNAQKNVPYTLKEAALTFEGGGYKYLDKIITVFAPAATRIDRVMKRDNTDKKSIEARMSKQMPDEEKVKRADFVIYNDGKQLLIPQILKIHKALLTLSSKHMLT